MQLTKKQSMTMATMEEMGVQNNDEGPHEQKKPHSPNYTAIEDVMVTMAYFKALEDLICGAKQKGHTFRSKIELAYNTIKKQQEEKEAQDLLQPSHLRSMDTVLSPTLLGLDCHCTSTSRKPFPLQLSSSFL